MLRRQRLEVADHVCMPAGCKLCVDAFLDGGESEVLEPRDLRLSPRLLREIGERRPPPMGERFAEDSRASLWVTGRYRGTRVCDESLEAVDVELVVFQLQHIARRAQQQALWRQ